MAALNPPSPPMSPSITRRSRSFARRCERYCCNTVLYFPLVVVYGLTTWAVWVQGHIGFLTANDTWTGYSSALVAFILYVLLNWSYTTAVFVSPGSPIDSRDGYSSLPTEESRISSTSLTAKASGGVRFCKKCQTRKPDRAHHCSTCRRCVLKMDHHCPWLAACVGFRNYKPFILFLIYTCLFCYVAFAASGTWTWREIADPTSMADQLMPVNYILLAVISGIIGLVITAFTGWHIYLACRGRTTIESLERVRYLAPIRKSMQQQLESQRHADHEPELLEGLGDQLREIHANALPGVTRPEEGEEHSSPARNSLRRSYADMERTRDVARYNDYLDEQEVKKLPHAFDLGWRRNLRHVFGERPALWWLPICNTTGNGWQWEVSPKFAAANEQLARDREGRRREEEAFENDRGSWHNSPNQRNSPSPYWNQSAMPPTNAKRLSTIASSDGEYASSDDEQPGTGTLSSGFGRGALPVQTANWNDVPDDFLAPTRGSVRGSGPRPRSRDPSSAALRPKGG